MSEPTRRYLKSAGRRQQLLDIAGGIFVDDGLAAVTVLAVSRAAGVSRRLVYDHFPDQTALWGAMLLDRVTPHLLAMDEIHERAVGEFADVMPQLFAVLLAIPTADITAIRRIVAEPDAVGLSGARSFLRDRLITRWGPYVSKFGDPDLVEAITWTTMNTLLVHVDQVHRGELTAERATALVTAQLRLAPALLAEAMEQLGAATPT